MAYRRFVSYIYEYPEGKKGENCGFVRVEVKNGICQMGFWMKAAGFPKESRLRVFGLIREEKRLLGIPVGGLDVGTGGVRGNVSFPERQSGTDAWRMEQFCGLLLISTGGRKFATQWEDEPLRLEQFEEWKENGQTIEQQTEEPMMNQYQQELPEEDTAPDQKEPEELPEERKPQEEEEAGQQKEETVQEPEQQEQSVLEENVERQEEKGVPLAAEIPSEKMSGCCRETDDPWEAVCGRCTKFQPFPDDIRMECVRIGRTELAALRKAGWRIDQNPFMEHGMQQFRHLLLGRAEESKKAYYLGVPGMFNTSEQFMAGMFGFGEFLAANPPREGRMAGNYGYWCRMVHPPYQRESR